MANLTFFGKPEPGASLAAVTGDGAGKIYGVNPGNTQLYILDTSLEEWSTGPTVPTASYWLHPFYYNGELYVLFTQAGDGDDVEVWKLSGGSWTQLLDHPDILGTQTFYIPGDLNAARVGTTFYALSLYSKAGITSAKILGYDAGTNTLTQTTLTFFPGLDCLFFAYNNLLYFVNQTQYWTYDPATGVESGPTDLGASFPVALGNGGQYAPIVETKAYYVTAENDYRNVYSLELSTFSASAVAEGTLITGRQGLQGTNRALPFVQDDKDLWMVTGRDSDGFLTTSVEKAQAVGTPETPVNVTATVV